MCALMHLLDELNTKWWGFYLDKLLNEWMFLRMFHKMRQIGTDKHVWIEPEQDTTPSNHISINELHDETEQ